MKVQVKNARATGSKGIGENGETDWLIKDMVEELKSWGHTGGPESSLILKCDGEPAIKAVRDMVGRMLGGTVVPENTPKNESQCNGAAEEAGKTVSEVVVVFKEQLEERAGIEIKPGDNITLWMIRWAAMNVSRYLVGQDGQTGYERRRGRKCNIPVARFGEMVWYRELRENKERRDKFSTEWKEGIWLGHSRNSNETLVGTDDGVVRAFAIRGFPEGQRWNGERIKRMQGTLKNPIL